GREDRAVLEAIEVAVGQQVAGAVPGSVVEQQAAEHTLLSFDRMRRHAQARDFIITCCVEGRRLEDGRHRFDPRQRNRGAYAYCARLATDNSVEIQWKNCGSPVRKKTKAGTKPAFSSRWTGSVRLAHDGKSDDDDEVTVR